MKRLPIALGLLSAVTALGQSFNVDFSTTVIGAPGYGVPGIGFKGAAGKPGPWNSVQTLSGGQLISTDGVVNGVTLTRSGNGVIASHGSGALGGDYEKLLEDFFKGDVGVNVTFTFNNLAAGTYALYTYALDPASPEVSLVTVTGSTSQADQQVGGVMGGESFFVGATHGLHVKTVAAGGSLSVVIEPPQPNMRAYVAGMQLVKLESSRLRIFVKYNGAGLGLGTSWADAFSSPVTALSTAKPAGGQNCEVWVGNGFYKPTGDTNRSKSFVIPSGLRLYGGFSGTETDPSQRPGSTLTYLNGDIGDANSDFDNSYTVVTADNCASGTLIDGFFIVNGYNDDSGHGGGLKMSNSAVLVRNCRFTSNTADNAGGGVYANQGWPMFVNCTFYKNVAGLGPAAYITDVSWFGMYNCEVLGNDSFSGGVFVDASPGELGGCCIHGNDAVVEGAGVTVSGQGADVVAANCTIAGNFSGYSGAGVYARYGATVDLRNSILWANRADEILPLLAHQYDFDGESGVTASFTTIEGAFGPFGADPLFIDGNGADNVWGNFDDDCRLQAGSPCIDQAHILLLPPDTADVDLDGDTTEFLPLDANGLPRVVGANVDRGAFEAQCQLAGDVNGDGAVDQSDLGVLLGNIQQNVPPNQDGDLDGDGFVGQPDLGILLANYGSTCF